MLSYMLKVVMDVLFNNPMRNLYFKGPWMNGWGFWSGKPSDEICSIINPYTNQIHWMKNSDECLYIIEKRYESFMIVVHFGCYVLFVYKLIQALWFRFFVMPSLAKEVAYYIDPPTNRKRLK